MRFPINRPAGRRPMGIGSLRSLFIVWGMCALCTLPATAQQSRLPGTAWGEFATAAARYDSLQAAIRTMQAADPSLADQSRLQARLAPDMARIQEIVQSLAPLARTALTTPVQADKLGIADLFIVKLAAQASGSLPLLAEIDTRLLTLVHDPDSLRAIRIETALVHASSAAPDKAEAVLAAGAREGAGSLDGASSIEKARLYAAMSSAFGEASALDKARHYALMAVLSFMGSRPELRVNQGDKLQDSTMIKKAQDQFLVGQIGGAIAPLLLQYAQKKDDATRDAFLKDAEAAVNDPGVWTGALVAAQGDVARKEKELKAVNKPAIEFAEHQWLGDEPYSVEKLRGKVILVDFFATWCRPCIMAFPHLREWNEKYTSQGLVVLGLTNYQGRYDGASVKPEEEFAKLRDDFAKKHKMTWAVGVERSGRKTFDAYDVNGIPHVVLIDRKGVIRYTKTGASDYDQTEAMIRKLLEEK